jgi:DNA-binding NarL/FixJ family response regulator
MEIAEALKIIRALADGVNPKTAENLPPDSVCRDTQCVCALHKAVGALEYAQERERFRQLLPQNAGKAWTREEEQQICDALRQGSNFQAIAKTHNRTVGSIVARLVRLGKINARPARDKAA